MDSRDIRNMTQYDFERTWLRGNPHEGKKAFTFYQKTNLQKKIVNFLEQVEAIQESASKK